MDNRSYSAIGAIITLAFGVGGAAAAITGFVLVFSRTAIQPGVWLLILGMLLMGAVVIRGQKWLAEQPGTRGQKELARSPTSSEDR